MAKSLEADGSLALCLSGGGLRATLFHLGVIRALRSSETDGRKAIERLSEVYSVSGGSILAAHMQLNWDRYIGSPDAYSDVENEILAFVQCNLRDRVLRRSILSAVPLFLWRRFAKRPVHGRIFWLCREYRALLDKALVQHSVRPTGNGPTLHILSTSFRSGELCSFSGNRFEVERTSTTRESTDTDNPDELRDELIATPCDHIPLAFAVAASSAFPPMFPPLVVDDDLLANPFPDELQNTILLSDGGVYDNLGIEKFRKNLKRRTESKPPLPGPGEVIISNAGASFRASSTKSYSGPLSRNVRASDILMRRIGDYTEDAIEGMTEVNDTVVKLSTIIQDAPLNTTVQQRLRLVRTDLDRFPTELAHLLIEHGERVTRHELAKKGWIFGPATPLHQDPSSTDLDALQARIGKAAGRSFWSLAFDFRDWCPLLALWALALLAGWGTITLGKSYLDAKAVEDAARKDIIAQNNEQRDRLQRAQAALSAGDIDTARAIIFKGVADAQDRADKPVVFAAPTPVPTSTPTVSLPGPAVNFPQRVYIQFAGTYTRDQITTLNQQLRTAGWNVQSTSGERVGAARTFDEVRYSAANADAARQLVTALNASGLVSGKVGLRQNQIIGDNLEIWISN